MRDGRKMKGVTEGRQRERDERKKEWMDGRMEGGANLRVMTSARCVCEERQKPIGET